MNEFWIRRDAAYLVSLLCNWYADELLREANSECPDFSRMARLERGQDRHPQYLGRVMHASVKELPPLMRRYARTYGRLSGDRFVR